MFESLKNAKIGNLPAQPLLMVAAGVVILIWPEILAYALAAYLLVAGGLDLWKARGK